MLLRHRDLTVTVHMFSPRLARLQSPHPNRGTSSLSRFGMGAPGRPPGPSLESDERPPGWRALFVWPMPALAALLILGVYIAIAQMMTSFKLQYYYDYTADVVVSLERSSGGPAAVAETAADQ